MDDEIGNRIAAVLAELVRQRSSDELRDPGLIRSELTQALGASAGQHGREIRVVAEAAAEGVPDRLAQGEQGLGEWYAEQTGYEVGIATWAVSVWSSAVSGGASSAGAAAPADVPVWSTPLPPPPGAGLEDPAPPRQPPPPDRDTGTPAEPGLPPPPAQGGTGAPQPPSPEGLAGLPPPPGQARPDPLPRDQQPTVVVDGSAGGASSPPPPPPPTPEKGGEDAGRSWVTPVVVAVVVGLVLVLGGVVVAIVAGSDSTDTEAEADSPGTSTASSSSEDRLLRRMAEFDECEPAAVPPEDGFESLAADDDLFGAVVIRPSAMVTCSGTGPVDQVDGWLFDRSTSSAREAFDEGAFAVDEDPVEVDDSDRPETQEFYVYESTKDASATLVELRDDDVIVSYSTISGSADALQRWYGVSTTTTTTTSTTTPSSPSTTFDRTQVIRDPARVSTTPTSAPFDIGDCAAGEGSVMVTLTPTPCTSATANYQMVAVAFALRGCPAEAPVEVAATVVLDGRTRAGYLCFAPV